MLLHEWNSLYFGSASTTRDAVLKPNIAAYRRTDCVLGPCSVSHSLWSSMWRTMTFDVRLFGRSCPSFVHFTPSGLSGVAVRLNVRGCDRETAYCTYHKVQPRIISYSSRALICFSAWLWFLVGKNKPVKRMHEEETRLCCPELCNQNKIEMISTKFSQLDFSSSSHLKKEIHLVLV